MPLERPKIGMVGEVGEVHQPSIFLKYINSTTRYLYVPSGTYIGKDTGIVSGNWIVGFGLGDLFFKKVLQLFLTWVLLSP